MKAIQVKEFGGSEVLNYTDVDIPSISSNEVLIKHESIGVNFIDIYQRSGAYPMDLPFIPGSEGAGIIAEVGKDIKDFKVGDKVAYSMACLLYTSDAADE